MVRPPLTNREENSMFVDTLPFPYYDMLIVNTFVKFGDLMYSVGRIEDGIKRGRIVDTGQAWWKREEVVSMSMCKQCLRKEEAKENCIRHGRSLSRIILIHHCMPKSLRSVFIHPRGSYRNAIETLIQAIPEAIKRKEPRCTIHFQCPIRNYSRYWSKTMGFLSFS